MRAFEAQLAIEERAAEIARNPKAMLPARSLYPLRIDHLVFYETFHPQIIGIDPETCHYNLMNYLELLDALTRNPTQPRIKDISVQAQLLVVDTFSFGVSLLTRRVDIDTSQFISAGLIAEPIEHDSVVPYFRHDERNLIGLVPDWIRKAGGALCRIMSDISPTTESEVYLQRRVALAGRVLGSHLNSIGDIKLVIPIVIKLPLEREFHPILDRPDNLAWVPIDQLTAEYYEGIQISPGLRYVACKLRDEFSEEV